MQVVANETAIFVAPQGLDGGWPNNGGADLKFIDAMNDYINRGLCVDQSQRFSIGFSYGGSMTYAIACARAKQFRGVAVIAGGQLSGCDGGNDPIAYFGIYGVQDGTLNIACGRQLRDRFVKNNGCDSMAGAKEPASGSRTHITTTATGCRTGYPIKWAAHDGGHIQAAADRRRMARLRGLGRRFGRFGIACRLSAAEYVVLIDAWSTKICLVGFVGGLI
jgi:poly(3-hydroxybutyrate) depolymerase